ncbi:MAG TPA: polyphosphate kinase 1 [Lacipirellulaceae bacterium]|jgi:polyphosphate kinase|nr:polyphosphate kinase 1 [Lacipirellulaceae bacterium]
MSTAGPQFLPEHFINRELSWLEFNARVLEEAEDGDNPLLERAKFLAIFASNLDEFFMVRVAGLREQAFGDMLPQDPPADGLKPLAQLQRIARRTEQLVAQQYGCWNEEILPALATAGVRIHAVKDLDATAVKSLDKYFRQVVFPVLTPMAIDPAHPSPRFHNRGLYLAAMLERVSGIGPQKLFAVVQVPQVLPRFVPVVQDDKQNFVWLEDLIASRLPDLFGGYKIADHAAFRLTRDMDVNLLEQEADDLLRSIESRLRARQRTEAVRLEISAGMNSSLLKMLVTEEELHYDTKPSAPGVPEAGYNEVYEVKGPLDMTCLHELVQMVDRKDLRDPPLVPRPPVNLYDYDDLFAEIADHDILLHHPYDSFVPVLNFIELAARDPQVLAIKQTLYRTSGGDSPVVRALAEAAENGKHVTALVELKARFDEANNITWARHLERAGVHVVFGFMGLKTHCKLAMVVRKEGKKVRRYVHLSTGNYNPNTALVYTDLGLFTADKIIAEDVSALFNLLTGYSQNHQWQKLVIAPSDLKRRTLELINEQTKRAREGKRSRIVAKLNSLVDRKTIEALYEASQAGVPIDLLIRGICCLRPGLPGISENIRVFSIVDRFLEHSRILIFGEGSKEQVFLSSADWMPRNFERRVEAMFPVESEDIRRRIVEEIIPTYLADNQHTRVLQSDGIYTRAVSNDNAPHRAQVELLAQAAARDSVANEKQIGALAGGAFTDLAETDGEAKRDAARRKKKKSSTAK